MNAMRFTRLELKNWKNFTQVNVSLASRVFLVGPNATGKSNFLDAFRFLRDLALEGGGLAKALSEEVRGGIGKVRSLYARGHNMEIMLRATVQDSTKAGWRYELAFTHESLRTLALALDVKSCTAFAPTAARRKC